MNSFYSEEEISKLGLKKYGKGVLISRKASIYSAEKITLGDNVRIDDFCILSGNITLGSNIHISAYVAIYGALGVMIEDYSGLSPHTTIFSAMDDFSGAFLIGPIHDKSKTNVTGGVVLIKKYVQIGACSTIYPNLSIGEGVVVGAHSLVNKSLEDWAIYFGVPAKFSKIRSKQLLDLI